MCVNCTAERDKPKTNQMFKVMVVANVMVVVVVVMMMVMVEVEVEVEMEVEVEVEGYTCTSARLHDVAACDPPPLLVHAPVLLQPLRCSSGCCGPSDSTRQLRARARAKAMLIADSSVVQVSGGWRCSGGGSFC